MKRTRRFLIGIEIYHGNIASKSQVQAHGIEEHISQAMSSAGSFGHRKVIMSSGR